MIPMRFATLGTYWGDRLAALLEGRLVDLSAVYAAYVQERQGLRRDPAVRLARAAIPPEMNDFLLAGPSAWERAREVADWALQTGRRDPDRLRNCTWSLDRKSVV